MRVSIKIEKGEEVSALARGEGKGYGKVMDVVAGIIKEATRVESGLREQNVDMGLSGIFDDVNQNCKCFVAHLKRNKGRVAFQVMYQEKHWVVRVNVTSDIGKAYAELFFFGESGLLDWVEFHKL